MLDEDTIDRYAEECVHAQRLALNAELEHPRGVLPWEGRAPLQKELDRRIASAVAARAVADAGLENDRARMLLAALGAHRGAIFDALADKIAGARYEADKKRWRDALRALGGEEDDRG
jgi:hypothetical protein